MDPEVLAKIRSGMGGLRPAEARDAVGNDECSYSYDTPWHESGLYINLKTFRGVGAKYVFQDAAASHCSLYAHSRWRRVFKEIAPEKKDDAPERLGVGIDGGFLTEDDVYETKRERGLVVIMSPERMERIDIACNDIPEFITVIIHSVLDHRGGSLPNSAMEQWAIDDGPPIISKYAAALPVIENPPQLSADPKTWKCGLTGDTENLWLNLSTGFVGGGRDQSAFGGPKGSNGALIHFQETDSQYPLVVKLGTISKAGGEVYSYAPDEDCRVDDPQLADHLARFGIEIMRLSKTEKTTAELEVDANAKFEWSAIAEAGEKLVPLSGPGLIGLVNLGNSCYMNSVIQLFLASTPIADRYDSSVLNQAISSQSNPSSDLLLQTAKIVYALRSDRYAKPSLLLEREAKKLSEDNNEHNHDAPLSTQMATAAKAARISPRTFKAAFGKSHLEFSTGQQQDAAEYFGHILELLTRAEFSSPAGASTARLFNFGLEERTECTTSKLARYRDTTTTRIDLPLPVPDDFEKEAKRTKVADDDTTTNPNDQTAKKMINIPFESCIEAWVADSYIEDFYSTALKRRGPAVRRTRISTNPPFLVVKLNRYYVDLNTWQPKKLDARVQMPETLDISVLKASPRPADEGLLPEDEEVQAPATEAIVPDDAILSQLVAMGFDENGCRRACIATKNASAEVAMEWVFTHSSDPDFSSPIVADSATPANNGIDESAVAEMTSLGFSSDQARAALTACDGSKERAADWLFSHMDDLDAACAAAMGATAATEATAPQSTQDIDNSSPSTKYTLVGFISHIGKNTGSGHYVAHIRKPGHGFVIFDDEKVAESRKPPLDLGYIYLYKRVDSDE